MNARVLKSDPSESLSLFAALAAPDVGTEITMDALAAIARSSKTVAAVSKARMQYLDPAVVKELPKGSKAYVIVVTNAGDEHHCAVTVGVMQPDGVRAHTSIYASRDAVRAAFP